MVIRIAFVLFGSRKDGPLGDQLFYSAQAIANARGDWFEQPFASGIPAADHPPLTALVITPVTWLFEWTGSVVTIQRLFMAIVGSMSIVVMALLVRHIGGSRSGLLAGAVTAVYVNVWINDGLIMAETLTFLLVASTALVILRARDAPTYGYFALVGSLTSFAALTRPELALLIPATGLFFILTLRGRFERGRLAMRMGTLIVVAGLVVAPWVIWNQVRFDGPVLLSTNDGLTIAGANCDSTYFDDVGGWDIWCAYAVEIPEGYDAARASSAMRSEGLAYWRENLDRYPIVAAARLARVFSFGYFDAAARASTAEGRPAWLSHIGTVQYWLLIPTAIVGFRRRTSTVQRVVLLGVVPIVVAVALVANAYVRFRVPAEVGLIALACLGIDEMLRPGRRRLSEQQPVSV